MRQFIKTSHALQLVLLSTAIWGVGYARMGLGPLQEALRVDLALSDNHVAWLQGPTIAGPMALGAIPLGLLVDRYSRARLFLVFVVVASVATAMTAFASSLTMLFISRGLIGFSIAGVTVAAYSMVADLYAPAQRGRATMVVAVGEVSGAPLAFAVGGMLLAMSGSAAVFGLEGWRWALLLMSVVLLPVLLLTFLVREPPRTGIVVKNPPVREVWPELWRYRAVLGPLLLARIMMWIADGAVLIWAAPSFSRRFDLPPDRIGAIMGSALLAGGLFGPIFGGPIADWCQRTGGPRRTITALMILALLSAPAALFILAPSATLAGVLLGVFLTLGYTLGTAALTVGTIVIPGEVRGLYLALTVTIGALFFIGAAPLVVSALSGALGGPAMIGQALAISCATTSLLGAIVLAVSRRNFPARGV